MVHPDRAVAAVKIFEGGSLTNCANDSALLLTFGCGVIRAICGRTTLEDLDRRDCTIRMYHAALAPPLTVDLARTESNVSVGRCDDNITISPAQNTVFRHAQYVPYPRY